ncbi:hypothetical protein ACH4VX_10180 [Streptomyces sp. NPDC020731]|uniref:hypothetical protein n=1 Tax=Streptomyces sp. NPDC020731 TaxID=3365085 RepID=UPI00378D649D
MIRSAAVPGAALRAMRTVAGRRAVQLALLVGAVFVLGVLCGEGARAADGGPAEKASSTIGALASADPGTPPDSNGPAPVIDVLTAPRPDAAAPARPLTETVARPVDERVVRPVGDLADAVTDRLDESTPGQLPALPELPALPALPGLEQPALPTLPVLPALPALPSLPALPALPALPGLEQPAPLPELPHLPDAPEQTLPGPSTPAPQPGTSTPPSDAPGQDAPDELKGPDGPSGTPEPVAGPGAHGPESTRAGGATQAEHGHRPARDAVRAGEAGDAGPAPAPHTPGTPAGQPDGTTGSRSAVDHGTPRHGDAYAVTAHHRPPLRLVPGPTVRVEAAGTRAPYRDVPVSPA